jgi:bifunctional non-homologous end joining protein LigD
LKARLSCLTKPRDPPRESIALFPDFGGHSIENVACELCRIAVSFRRPSQKLLAAILAECAQFLVGARHGKSGLFPEFPLRGRQGIFAWIYDPFGDGPSRRVFSGPDRPAHMDQKNLEAAGRTSVQKQASAVDGHRKIMAGHPPPKAKAPKVPFARSGYMAKARTGRTKGQGGGPAFQPPQLATLVDHVPPGSAWVHEMKYDGYRCLVAIGGGRARAYTRSGLDWSEKFGPIVEAAGKLKAGSALIDGEAVVLDADGKSNFQALQASLKGGKADLVYFAFDLLELNGKDLKSEPLLARKAKLAKLIGVGKGVIRFSAHIQGQGEKLLQSFCEAGLEGVVSKRADSRYSGVRSDSWLKTKCIRRQEFVVVGWTPSDKARGFRSLLLGVNEKGKLRYAGKVGTGFDAREMDRLLKRMKPLEQKIATVAAPRAAIKGAHWLAPKLVAEIDYTEETTDGVLRHPSYLGLRDDKKPEAVVVEKAVSVKNVASKRKSVTITNRDRVLFPESGVTKGALADYYQAVAEIMLPWTVERPISLIRCPQGRAKKCFFQKHDAGSFGDAVKHVAIREKYGTSEPYLFIENEVGLLTCVQMGTIEFHGWGSRIEDVEKADRLVFDLDPDEGLDFKAVKAAAFDFRKALDHLGLKTFPMVTGGKGVHVIAPLTPHAEWPAVKHFALSFAAAMAATQPDRFTAALSKAKRGGKIFVDYLRNQRGATAVMPYSVRARPDAPVAVPLSWEELRDIDRPSHWHVEDAKELVKHAGSKAMRGWGRADQRLPKL